MKSTKTSDHQIDILRGKIAKEMSFEEKVWAVTARIPRGQVATYGDVAAALQCQAYRAVGAALGRNPFAPDVPCHRVVASSGHLNGFAEGLPKKERMLIAEGVAVNRQTVNLKALRVKPAVLAGRTR